MVVYILRNAYIETCVFKYKMFWSSVERQYPSPHEVSCGAPCEGDPEVVEGPPRDHKLHIRKPLSANCERAIIFCSLSRAVLECTKYNSQLELSSKNMLYFQRKPFSCTLLRVLAEETFPS